MSNPTRRLVMAAILAGVAAPTLAAPSDSELRLAGENPVAAKDTTSTRLADNDGDDNRWWRKDGRRGDDDHRRGQHHDDDHDDDDDDDDDRRSAPRRTSPAPAQNPLIGVPRASTN